MDGGNYLTDGFGNLFCDAKQPDIDLVTFGITDSVRVADYKVHIDYYLKLINEETFIVNEIPFSNYRPPFDYFFGDSAVLDSVVERLSQRISCYGRPYKFIRIKTAPTLDSNNVTVFTSEASYANSLILNRTVLVPQYQYSVQTDTAALNLYKKLMPGYRVVGIPAWHFAGMGGTIHCITREIASDEPVFVSHAWYPDTVNQTSGYPVEAVIRTRSGVANAAVYWTTDTTLGFQAIAMTNPGGDTFTASVPGQAYGTRVYYYIQAAANSSKVGKKPLVAPSWAYNFLVLEPGACVAKPGDANASGTYTLGDVISGVNYIFNKPGCVPTPLCWLSGLLCRGDWNASGTVTLGDVIQAVNFIFNKPGGPWNALAVGVCCLP